MEAAGIVKNQGGVTEGDLEMTVMCPIEDEIKSEGQLWEFHSCFQNILNNLIKTGVVVTCHEKLSEDGRYLLVGPNY